MVWYNKYLSVFEKPISDIPQAIIAEIKDKVKQRESTEPVVSVVLIAHNEEQHLLSCIWSLVDNKCHYPMELIAINNNSTDKTTEVLDLLGVTWYNECKKGPGFARQCGLTYAKGIYHICIDADTMYPPYYIETHIKELEKPNIVCSYGLWSFIPDKKHSQTALFFYELLRDIHLCIQQIKRPELNVRGMVFAFKTEIGRKYGFRTDILRGEDGSLA
jgi:glycosyltransferase involved in cell wall biosynthesis